MKIHRFMVTHIGSYDQCMVNDIEIVNQIKSVLRLKAGDEIIVCDGNNNEAVAFIEDIQKERVVAKILERRKVLGESSVHTLLYCAIAKRENFEWVCQKATEAGIREITPIISSRTVKLNIKTDRIKKIIREAAEQSGRGFLPVITEPTEISHALESAKKNNANIFFYKEAQKFSHIKMPVIQSGSVGAFIGPEGGWDEKELQLFKKSGFLSASLGDFTFRTETAALLASYLVVLAFHKKIS